MNANQLRCEPSAATSMPKPSPRATGGLQVRRQHGGTALGFIAGLALGLLVALAIAIWMTKAPLPFVDKVGQRPGDKAGAEQAATPDPNKMLYPKGAAQPVPAQPAPEPTPPGITPAPVPAAVGTPAPAATPTPPAPQPVLPPAQPKPADEGKTAYQLQAGAFRNPDDAEQMKAKLAMLGFEARVTQADRDGETYHRVRVGPYSGMEDLNKARARLAENGVEATVVRLK